MEQDSTQQIIAAFRKLNQESLVGRMGITISDASAERVTGTMPVAGNTQPYGLLHAGPGRVTIGLDISATHHRAAADGEVTGVATRLHGGRTITSYEIVISDEQGRRVCTSRLTCLIRDGVPGGGQDPSAGLLPG